jgi:hypothetical protein
MRRRRYVIAPVVLAVLVVLAVVGAQLRSDAPRRQSQSRPRTATAAPARLLPTVLLAHRGPAGKVDLAVVVGARAGRDGSVLLLPTLTAAETPSFDPQLLADQLNLGGQQLLQTTVANLLGVRIDQVAVVESPTLVDVLNAAGPLDVNLRDPVEAQGRAFPAGPQQLAPGDVATLLTTPARTGELDHLVTVQAAFEGWMRAVKRPDVAAATTARVPALDTLISAAQVPAKFSTLPVDALGPAMRAAYPDRLLGVGGRRPRVEILNGTGTAGLARQVAAVVVPAGGQVVATTGNGPAGGRPVTQVVYYRDENRPAAAALLAALGAGELVKQSRDFGAFDVTILAGADFKSAVGA